MKTQYTIAQTTRTKYDIQFKGNLTQTKLERLCDRYKLGYLLDYMVCNEGELVSSQIGTKFDDTGLLWTIDPNVEQTTA